MLRTPLRLALTWALCCSVARAEDAAVSDAVVDDSARLEVSRGIVKSTAEFIGMGGTGVALGVGGPGLFHNPAATSHRKAENRSELAIGPGLGFSLVSPRGGGNDVANLPADAANVLAEQDWQGAILNAAMNVAWRRLGVGWAGSGTAWWRPDQRLIVADSQFVVGGVVAGDRLNLAGGLRRLDADLETADGYAAYRGVAPQLGFIYHAPREGLAFGAAWWSAATARETTGDGIRPADAIVVPHRLSAGIAWTSESTDDLELAVPMRYAADLVVDAPSRDAVALEAHMAGLSVERGTRWTLSPRVGAEADVWPERLRIRAGTYWEPARNVGASGRVHVTGGYELKLFRFKALGIIDEVLALEGSVDVASRYSSLGVINLGMWRSGVTGAHAEGLYGEE
ncbi:MAG: hypothetical protein H6742_05390 [Alphaproteobacteria bacterium]|nr:hypothetical protein [Alphaproteobacteria bacterium]